MKHAYITLAFEKAASEKVPTLSYENNTCLMQQSEFTTYVKKLLPGDYYITAYRVRHKGAYMHLLKVSSDICTYKVHDNIEAIICTSALYTIFSYVPKSIHYSYIMKGRMI